MQLYPDDDEVVGVKQENSSAIGQPPGFKTAGEAEPMCDECAHYDGAGRKCSRFNVEAAPFNTCRAHEPKMERKLDPNMLQMGMPPGMPPSGGMPPGM